MIQSGMKFLEKIFGGSERVNNIPDGNEVVESWEVKPRDHGVYLREVISNNTYFVTTEIGDGFFWTGGPSFDFTEEVEIRDPTRIAYLRGVIEDSKK